MDVWQRIEFVRWLSRLRDHVGRAVIVRRVKRFAQGNPGDTRDLGGGLQELRIHFGPGYRVYFVRRGVTLIVLLCGGDKSSQAADIGKARRLATDEGETHEFEDDGV